MPINLFDVQVRIRVDGKQVYPVEPAPVPVKQPTPCQSVLICLGLAALVVAALVFLAWWGGYLS